MEPPGCVVLGVSGTARRTMMDTEASMRDAVVPLCAYSEAGGSGWHRRCGSDIRIELPLGST